MDETSVAELLAEAYNLAFTGSLELVPEHEARSVIQLSSGSVREATGPWNSPLLAQESLAALLPPDLLALGLEHSRQYAVDLFTAVERLKLLPDGGLSAARDALVLHGLRAICRLPPSTRYEFVPGIEAPVRSSGVDSVLEPLSLIVACALADPRAQRAEELVSAFADGELSLDPIGARSLLATLSGPVRAVAESLTRSPKTLAELRARAARTEPLTAALYALWLTHHLRIRARDSTQPQARSRTSSQPADRENTSDRPGRSQAPPSASVMPQQRSPTSVSGVSPAFTPSVRPRVSQSFAPSAPPQPSRTPAPSSVSGVSPAFKSSAPPGAARSYAPSAPSGNSQSFTPSPPPGASRSFTPSSASGAPPQRSAEPRSVSGMSPRASAAPPDADSPEARASAARQNIVKERSLEDKVVEAWSLAQADSASVERGIGFVRKASSVFPKNARMRFYLARLLERHGELPEAIRELERVLALDPNYPEASRELRRLRTSLAPPSVGDRLKRLFGKD
jgi:hypothetical protein